MSAAAGVELGQLALMSEDTVYTTETNVIGAQLITTAGGSMQVVGLFIDGFHHIAGVNPAVELRIVLTPNDALALAARLEQAAEQARRQEQD